VRAAVVRSIESLNPEGLIGGFAAQSRFFERAHRETLMFRLLVISGPTIPRSAFPMDIPRGTHYRRPLAEVKRFSLAIWKSTGFPNEKFFFDFPEVSRRSRIRQRRLHRETNTRLRPRHSMKNGRSVLRRRHMWTHLKKIAAFQ